MTRGVITIRIILTDDLSRYHNYPKLNFERPHHRDGEGLDDDDDDDDDGADSKTFPECTRRLALQWLRLLCKLTSRPKSNEPQTSKDRFLAAFVDGAKVSCM